MFVWKQLIANFVSHWWNQQTINNITKTVLFVWKQLIANFVSHWWNQQPIRKTAVYLDKV